MLHPWLLLLAGVLAPGPAPVADDDPPPPVPVPPAAVITLDDANRALKEALDLRYQELDARLQAWQKRRVAFDGTYGDRKFPKGSKEAKDGAAEFAWLTRELEEYTTARRAFAIDVGKLRVDRARRIALMNEKARDLKWDKAELDRLDRAMNKLARDGDQKATLDSIARTWQAVEARGQDPGLAREAAAGTGPGLPGAGTQSFNDCTIFALANASGELYEAVAARATRLIEDGAWRAAADRAHAQQVIERHGLNGDEVIMLAESFGQAEVVPSTDFSKTLKDGRPILAGVSVVGEDDREYYHQVVMTRSFQHDHETWYEMQDSNQGPLQRRYLSARELNILLFENGVAYRPEPGRTPKLLRPEESK